MSSRKRQSTHTTTKLTDPPVISLDIETYGACEENIDAKSLPKQSVFNPQRSIHTDGVPLKDLNLTAAITIPHSEGLEPKEWGVEHLKALQPKETFVFQLHLKEDRLRLQRWLRYAEVIIGMNLQFDLQYLRTDPFFRFGLQSQLLVDLSVLNYLHDETRPERSLKSLGPVLRTHSYTETLKDKRFINPKAKELHEYNAQDTHNTMLAVGELAKRISQDFPYSPKLSSWCLRFYSDTIWTCIRMSESGIPMDFDVLTSLEEQLTKQCDHANSASAELYGLPLEGIGSGKAKSRFIDLICDTIDGLIECTTPTQCKKLMMLSEESPDSLEDSSSSGQRLSCYSESVRDHPLLQITPKRGAISFSEENRNLLRDALPEASPLREALDLAKQHSSSQKLISSYLFPLLRHRRNKPEDKSSVLIPLKDSIGLAFPTWYIVPTFAKDSGGSEGGTLQGRITCKKPSAQTFPPSIKSALRSRFNNGVIVGFDLSQIELRVAALLSGDPGLMEAYTQGADLHTERALQIFGAVDKEDPDFHGYRQAGKMINFADLFRAGPNKMQAQLLAMTGELYDLDFFQNVASSRPVHRPGLWKWQNDQINKVKRQGYSVLPFTGQSRYFMGGDKYMVNEIVNFPIQTTAGNTLLRIQSYIHQRMPSINSPNQGILMFLNVYDAIYFDVKAHLLEDLINLVREAVTFVETEGYWSMIQNEVGRKVPLEYDQEILWKAEGLDELPLVV